MEKLMDVAAADLAGVYKEVAETVGVENAYKLYRHFRGLQMLFPLRFYSNEYIAKRICDEYDEKNVRDLARKYGYSESRVRQILRVAKVEKTESTVKRQKVT